MEQMKGFSDQFNGVLETAGLSPLDLKNGARGISSYFKKIESGILGNEVRNTTVEKSLNMLRNGVQKHRRTEQKS